MKTISLLGSTGSIGTQTLDVIRRNKDIKVAALAAGTRVKELAAQAREFKPELVCIGSEKLAGDLKTELADMDVRIVSGSEGLIEAATIASADIVLTAVVGMMGIVPTIRAIEAGKDIALANKETLVTAGHIIMPLAKEKNVRQQRLAGPRLHHYPAGRIHEVRDVHMASLVVACLQQDVPQEGNQSICRAVGAVCDRRGTGDGRQGPRHGHDSGLHRRRGLSDRRVPRQMDGSRRIGRGGYGRCIGGFQPEPLASYSGHIWRLLGR